MTALSQRRAADRAAMADRMEEIGRKHGAEVERRPGWLNDREILMHLRLPGAYVMFSFEPEAEGPGGWGFLGHWVCERGNRFRTAFNWDCQGSRSSPHPHHKATTYADDFDDFARVIDRALAVVASGGAFVEQQELAA